MLRGANLYSLSIPYISAGQCHALSSALAHSNIRKLSLSGNAIGDAGLADLMDVLPTVGSFRLSSCGLTDASLDNILALLASRARLFELDLRGNQFSEEAKARIHGANTAFELYIYDYDTEFSMSSSEMLRWFAQQHQPR